MSDLSKVSTKSIEGVSKLEALLFEFHKQKDVFDSIPESILVKLDDKATNYAKQVAAYEKDLCFVSDISATYEGKIKMFHKVLSIKERRESLTLSDDINQSFGLSINPSILIQSYIEFQCQNLMAISLNFRIEEVCSNTLTIIQK